LTCNRDDFLNLATTRPHQGIVIVIRRRTRVDERLRCFGCWNVLARRVSEQRQLRLIDGDAAGCSDPCRKTRRAGMMER